MRVKIENTYSDGHESERIAEVREPEDGEDMEDFWEDVIFQETGDGHGISRDIESFYEATILESASPSLVGLHREWC